MPSTSSRRSVGGKRSSLRPRRFPSLVQQPGHRPRNCRGRPLRRSRVPAACGAAGHRRVRIGRAVRLPPAVPGVSAQGREGGTGIGNRHFISDGDRLWNTLHGRGEGRVPDRGPRGRLPLRRLERLRLDRRANLHRERAARSSHSHRDLRLLPPPGSQDSLSDQPKGPHPHHLTVHWSRGNLG